MTTPQNPPDLVNKALNKIKEHLDLGSDAQLAGRLGVSKQMLSLVRKGESRPPKLVLKVMDLAGYAVTRDMLLQLVPQGLAAVTKLADNSRANKKAAEWPDKARAKSQEDLEHSVLMATLNFTDEEIIDIVSSAILKAHTR